jgi:hypothetical protein
LGVIAATAASTVVAIICWLSISAWCVHVANTDRLSVTGMPNITVEISSKSLFKESALLVLVLYTERR